MTGWMQCERDLDDGKKLVVVAEVLSKKDQPLVSVYIADGNKQTMILEGTSSDINALAEWLQSRVDDARMVHRLRNIGWKER